MTASVVRSFDPIVLPYASYEIETSAPEESVAVALGGVAGALHRDGFWLGHQRLRGSVKFGQIDFALIRRERLAGPELFTSEENPMVWTAWLLLRGSVREQAGSTRVKLVFLPGHSLTLAMLAMTVVAAYFCVRWDWAFELMIAPGLTWLGLLGGHRAALRHVRPHAFAALGLPAR